MLLETARRHVRNLLGYRSWPYRLGSKIITLLRLLASERFGAFPILSALNKTGPTRDVVLTFRRLAHPITLRTTGDDLPALIKNAVREEWGQFTTGFGPRCIVDAGAYIGDTSAYFLSRFPDARVIALEPNPDSYGRAKKNLAPYGARIELENVALAANSGLQRIAGDEMSAKLSTRGNAVHTITMSDLIKRFDLRTIDLLKLDIEGAEEDIICSGPAAWLDRVRLLAVETHGDAIERRVLKAMAQCGFEVHRFRNVHYCARATDRKLLRV